MWATNMVSVTRRVGEDWLLSSRWRTISTLLLQEADWRVS
ncbi:Uncharacterised protein [Segatella copri]|nr:Uncharacterised protein [Segatella copri]